MRHFIFLVGGVFLFLFLATLNRTDRLSTADAAPTVRIFGYSSFTGSWGPGPRLRELFEKECHCKVEFIEGSDSAILLQRLKIEGASLGADLVVGLDQFDLQKALASLSWQKVNFKSIHLEPEMQSQINNDYFIPYDWGYLGVMVRKSKIDQTSLSSMDDLLLPEMKGRLVLQDPRTSSPGLLFLYWVIHSKGEVAGFKFIKKLMDQVYSFTPSWSTAIGLYNKGQADAVFSYFTSPLYYQVEERNLDHEVLEFTEPHPLQIEFAGIPEICRQCDLAERFVNLMLSPEGQKIIMEKNYMLPVVSGVLAQGPFSSFKKPKQVLKFEIPSESEVEGWLKTWSEIRRGGGPPL